MQVMHALFQFNHRKFAGILSKFLLMACSACMLILTACSGNGGTSSPDVNDPEPIDPADTIDPEVAGKMTVVVAVIDSLMIEDVFPNGVAMGPNATATPNLAELIANGTVFTESRSVFSGETIPNHVAMMTGLNPDRNGIPTNNFWDRESGGDKDGEDLDNPNELTAKTLFTWIDETCTGDNDITTAAVMSKNYLYHIFNAETDPNAVPGDGAGTPQDSSGLGKGPGDEPRLEATNDIVDIGGMAFTNVSPDIHWDPKASPAYIKQGSEHTPDASTGPESVGTIDDSNFLFINFGDVDRSSHASGSSARAAAVAQADVQLGSLITRLMETDRWENTLFIVVSDHGMDFSVAPEPGANQGEFDESFDDPLAGLTPVDVVSGGPAFTSCATADSNQAQCVPNLTGNLALASVSTQPLLDDLASDDCGFEEMIAVQNGGTNSIAVTSGVSTDSDDAMESLLAARTCILNRDGTDTNMPACDTVLDNFAVNPAECKSDVRIIGNANAVEFGWYVNPALYDNAQPDTLKPLLASNDPTGVMPATLKSRHENLGDLVLVMGDAFKFSEPDPSGNPIPGNHGHTVTVHNTMIVSGGLDILQTNMVVSTGSADHFERNPMQSENIDVGVTVAWALGLIAIDATGNHVDGGLIEAADFPDVNVTLPNYTGTTVRQGFDGRVLLEAFTTTTAPSACGNIPVMP